MLQRVSEQKAGELPRVSVAMITYNHEKYIAQATESVLMQETDFAVELVIGEDCSTDATRRIVQEYADRYPNVVRAILHKTNQGMQGNGLSVFGACRGKYVALLEGDDYWSSGDKLRQQVKILDEDPGVSLVFHQAVSVTGTRSRPYRAATHGDQMFTFADFASLRLGEVPTASVMVRKAVLKNLPDWFARLPFGDLAILGLAAEAGRLCFLDQCWAGYRVHAGGAAGQMLFGDTNRFLQKNLQFEDGQLRLFGQMLRRNEQNRDDLRKSMGVFCLNAAWAARLLAQPARSLRYVLQAFAAQPLASLRSGKFWKALAFGAFPFVDSRRTKHVESIERELQERRGNSGFSDSLATMDLK